MSINFQTLPASSQPEVIAAKAAANRAKHAAAEKARRAAKKAAAAAAANKPAGDDSVKVGKAAVAAVKAKFGKPANLGEKIAAEFDAVVASHEAEENAAAEADAIAAKVVGKPAKAKPASALQQHEAKIAAGAVSYKAHLFLGSGQWERAEASTAEGILEIGADMKAAYPDASADVIYFAVDASGASTTVTKASLAPAGRILPDLTEAARAKPAKAARKTPADRLAEASQGKPAKAAKVAKEKAPKAEKASGEPKAERNAPGAGTRNAVIFAHLTRKEGTTKAEIDAALKAFQPDRPANCGIRNDAKLFANRYGLKVNQSGEGKATRFWLVAI
jgi:hypothetical protein